MVNRLSHDVGTSHKSDYMYLVKGMSNVLNRERQNTCKRFLQISHILQSDSVARSPKLLSMYTAEQRGFLVRKYWQTGFFKACQTAFRKEFGERRAPTKYCIQKLVKMLVTR